MKSLAREFGRSGTTANTVSLGLVETDHDKDWVEANREKLVRAKGICNSAGEARLFRHAVKRIRQEHKIGRACDHSVDVISIAFDEGAISNAMLRKATARHIQHRAFDVDGGDVARDLCHRQSEPSVTAAQIDHLHAGRNAYAGDG